MTFERGTPAAIVSKEAHAQQQGVKNRVQTEYVNDVFRFGGFQPYGIKGKGRINLNQKDTFSLDDVTLDDKGNILDMPLLRRKPCFARPERYYIGISEKEFRDTRNAAKQCVEEVPTRCQRCPVQEVCGTICDKRVASDPSISAAFADCSGIGHAQPYRHPLRNSAWLREWVRFLHAIRNHGGWSNVNDARVAMDDYKREEERREKRRRAAREKRRQEQLARRKTSKAKPVTAAFNQELDMEQERRLKILLDVRQWPQSPKWITRLNQTDCEFHVAVWALRENLKRRNEKCNGIAIANVMQQRPPDWGAITPNSLRTKVYRALGRIAKLEDERSGNPVWQPFRPLG